jgi:hypothetical protein
MTTATTSNEAAEVFRPRAGCLWRTARRCAQGVLSVSLSALVLTGCGESVDPTPEKLDGSPSHEFEQDDLDRAAGASDAVKEYCSGAVSEAQRIGCESHVTEDDIP